MNIIEWFLRQPIAANLTTLFILVSGLLTLNQLRSEAFPKLPANSISITVVFDSHTAEQINRSVTQKIEAALEGTNGIKHVFSVSYDGSTVVQVIRSDNYNLDQLLIMVKSRIDAIESWPIGAERPIIEQQVFSYPSLIVQVYGGSDDNTRQQVAEQVKQALLAQPDIARIKT